MDRLPLAISLQQQNTWPLRIVWVVLNNLCICNSGQHIPNQDVIFSQLIVAVA